MMTLPAGMDFTATQAVQKAQEARERLNERSQILLGYLNQIRAALNLGETKLTTTCLVHELDWLARELRDREFLVHTEVHLMHGQITVRCPETV